MHAAERPATAARAERRGRLLVIDDEKLIATAIQRVLQLDHDVACAMRAEDALELFNRGEQFDVILCDLMMPTMTGMELYAALLRLAPEQARRFIFVTGGACSVEARAFMATVPNAFVEKPFTAQALRSMVNARVLVGA
jgi:CheY-like chemotaxis protein